MKELVEKFQKMSSVQLVEKIEKGVENEAEKNVIISILQKRGRDTSPYSGKTPEQIAQEAKLDAKQKTQKVKVEKVKVEKVKKERAPRAEKGSKRKVKYEDESFKAGLQVTASGSSKRLGEGEKATVKYTFHFEGKDDVKMAYLKNLNGKSLKKKVSELSLCVEEPQMETAE